jgi:hypothetical protein
MASLLWRGLWPGLIVQTAPRFLFLLLPGFFDQRKRRLVVLSEPSDQKTEYVDGSDPLFSRRTAGEKMYLVVFLFIFARAYLVVLQYFSIINPLVVKTMLVHYTALLCNARLILGYKVNRS